MSKKRIAFILLAAAGLIYVGYLVKELVISFLLAFWVAYILEPAVNFLARRRIPRGVAVFILILVALLTISAVFLQATPVLIAELRQGAELLNRELPKLKDWGQSLLPQAWQDVSLRADTLSGYLANWADRLQSAQPQILSIVKRVASSLFRGTLGALGAIVNFLLFAVVTVYLLKDFDSLINWLKQLFPEHYQERLFMLVGQVDSSLRAFFRGQLIVCLILAAVYSAGLALVGAPLPIVMGLLAGLGNLMPYMGIVIGVLPAVGLTALKYEADPYRLLAVLGIFAGGTILENVVLTPKIIGEKLQLHAVAIILSLLVWGKLLGFMGLLLAIPIAAVIKVVGAEALREYKSSGFFTGQPQKKSTARTKSSPRRRKE